MLTRITGLDHSGIGSGCRACLYGWVKWGSFRAMAQTNSGGEMERIMCAVRMLVVHARMEFTSPSHEGLFEYHSDHLRRVPPTRFLRRTELQGMVGTATPIRYGGDVTILPSGIFLLRVPLQVGADTWE